MAASAGSLLATGASGRRYMVDLYLPDAVAGLVGFNPSGAAASTSPTNWRPVEDVTVTDIIIVTGTTATGATFLADGSAFNGNQIRYAAQLTTLNNRPYIGWGFRGGTLVSATQT